MSNIKVTEDNFDKVLEKLRKICNKYKMFQFSMVLSDDMTEQKEYRRNSIGFRDEIKKLKDKNGELRYKKVKKLFAYSNYVMVTKHHFREDFENDKDSYNAKYMYPKMKSLIHFSLSGSSALVISEGDKVQFLPFGGFIVFTDNDYTRFDNPLVIYKDIFIPDVFNGRITNLEEENTTRDKELEEADSWYDEQYLNDMEREMMEDYEW